MRKYRIVFDNLYSSCGDRLKKFIDFAYNNYCPISTWEDFKESKYYIEYNDGDSNLFVDGWKKISSNNDQQFYGEFIFGYKDLKDAENALNEIKEKSKLVVVSSNKENKENCQFKICYEDEF